MYYDDELYHYGVKGMRWGIRRRLGAKLQYLGKKRRLKKSFKKDVKAAKKQMRDHIVNQMRNTSKSLNEHGYNYTNTIAVMDAVAARYGKQGRRIAKKIKKAKKELKKNKESNKATLKRLKQNYKAQFKKK